MSFHLNFPNLIKAELEMPLDRPIYQLLINEIGEQKTKIHTVKITQFLGAH